MPLHTHGAHGKDRVRSDWSNFEKPTPATQEEPSIIPKEAESNFTPAESLALTGKWKANEADKEFIKQDKPEESPFLSSDGVKLVQATLNAMTILAFLDGPPGIVLAAGLSFASGMLGLSTGAMKQVGDVAKTISEVQGTENLVVLLANLRSFTSWCNVNKDKFESLEKYEEHYAQGTASPQTDLVVNEAVWLQPIISHLRDETIPGGPERLASCTNALGSLAVVTPWNRSDIRAAIIHASSLLFVAYKYLAVTHARMALGARHHKTGQGLQTYLDNICACYNALKEMKAVIADRKDGVLGRIEKAKKWRREQVSDVHIDTENNPWKDAAPRYYTRFKDSVTDKVVCERTPMQGLHFIWDKEPNFTDDKKGEVEHEREAYMRRLEEHMDRVFLADTKIIASWDQIAEQISHILAPLAPTNPPEFVEYRQAERPNPFLHGYTKVAYAYTVTTPHGTSGYSTWTQDYILEHEGNKTRLPALKFGSSVFIPGAEPTITVYHRVSAPMSENDVKTKEGKTVVWQNLTKEVIWADEEQLPHGRG